MGIFKVHQDPQLFFQHVKENIDVELQSQVGFIFYNKKVYIKSANEDIIHIIQLKCKLIPSEDSETRNPDRKWRCLANIG
jgi:hypothetical protein